MQNGYFLFHKDEGKVDAISSQQLSNIAKKKCITLSARHPANKCNRPSTIKVRDELMENGYCENWNWEVK